MTDPTAPPAAGLDPRSFDAKAPTWDTPARVARAAAAADAIRSAVRFPPGCRAIEIGAGTGLLGLALLDQLTELVLADTSEGMLEEARRKITDRGLTNSRTIHFDLVGDPLPDGAPFDAALSQLVLHHIEDTPAGLSGFRRLLRPGGLLVALDLDTEDGSFHGDIGQGVHHPGFDRARLARLTEGAGFVDVQVRDGGTVGGAEHDDVPYPMFLLTARRR
jgi:ubiquinone/menaquinone biosynthesis C-methylase UbiE